MTGQELIRLWDERDRRYAESRNRPTAAGRQAVRAWRFVEAGRVDPKDPALQLVALGWEVPRAVKRSAA